MSSSSRIKKFNELTNEIQKTIREAKDKLLNAIISDHEISKIEKLKLISDNDLFATHSYMCDPFEDEYKGEYLEELKKKNILHPMIDDYIDIEDYERYKIVNLADLVESVNEYGEDLITIYTNRGNADKFQISRYEFIDTVYDWCLKHKIIAFEIDW